MTTSTTFINLEINDAQQLKKSAGELETDSKLYITFGKVDPWANDASPNVSNASVATFYEIWDNMIGGKRLFAGDISHVIPRYDWSSGETYIAYDHRNENLYIPNTKFYIMTNDLNIYKCIANNKGSPSTVKPTSLSTSSVQQTADGYYWKYMYTISDAERLRFMTSSYIPVRGVTGDDGSLQWQVQKSAIDGAIDSIVVKNGGTGYSNSNTVSVVVSGDGTSLSAYATLNLISNSVSSITITNPGTGYTYADVKIVDSRTDPGVGASAYAIISPPGGHGSDPLYELGGKDLLIDAQIKGSEEGVLPINNDYRQISLIKDPISASTNKVMTDPAFVQAYELILVGSGNYIQDELVYEGPSLAAAVYVGRVATWDPTTNKILLINNKGVPLASRTLIGTQSFTARVVTSIKEGALRKLKGKILYVDNISPVTRSNDQIEDFKIVVKF